jgi:hypothetical protein
MRAAAAVAVKLEAVVRVALDQRVVRVALLLAGVRVLPIPVVVVAVQV